MKLEPKEKVAEKIKSIRAAAAADKASKIKDGVRRAGQGETVEDSGEPRAGGTGGRVTFAVPEAIKEVDFTKAEQEMSDLIRGPDARWVEEVPHQQTRHPGRNGESALMRRRRWRTELRS